MEASQGARALLYAGRRTEVGPAGVMIGRAEDNELLFPASTSLAATPGRGERGRDCGHDLGSRHGTAVNGEPLGEEPRVLAAGT